MAIFHSYVKLPEGIWVLQLDALAPKKVTSPSVVPWVFGDQEGLASGEGRALRLLAEIYAKQEQHKAAIRWDLLSTDKDGDFMVINMGRYYGYGYVYIYIYIRTYVCYVM